MEYLFFLGAPGLEQNRFVLKNILNVNPSCDTKQPFCEYG